MRSSRASKSREELAAQTQGLEALRTYARLAHLRYDNGYSATSKCWTRSALCSAPSSTTRA